MAGMLVLVTGGTGYVGSHSVAALIRAGHRAGVLARSPDRVAAALAPLRVEVERFEVDTISEDDAEGSET
jgi:uncharacterized protein YbjT (DUF2867 family)